MSKKILYIINHMDWFWSHRLPLARGAKAAGWQVDVAGSGAHADEKLGAHAFTGHDLPRGDTGFAPFTVLKLIFAIRALIIKNKPDLVHVITLKYVFIAGLAVRLCSGVKIVHTVAGLGYLFSGEDPKAKVLRFFIGPFLKLALNHKNAQVIVQNPDDMALLLARGFVDADRCHLIRGSGVDMDEFPFVPEPETDQPLVIMPTRLVHDKGIAVFIEMANILGAHGVQAKFQIAGGVSLHNPLAITTAEMEDMIAGSNAQWLGRVDDMPDLYARSNLVVYPSYYGEGVPKVLLEAMATGRAIVTTDHAGCREAVDHGKNGYLVPIKDAAKTAEMVVALLIDASKRHEMGKNSRIKADTEFNVNLVTANTIKVYSF